MSSNFIPMLPSTPPPLDASVESDDDEFGNFTTAFGEYADSLVGVKEKRHSDVETKIEKFSSTNCYVQSQNDVNIQNKEIHVNNSYSNFSHFSNDSIENEEIKEPISEKTVTVQNSKNGKVYRSTIQIPSDIQRNKIDGCREYIFNGHESESPDIKIEMTVCHPVENDDCTSKECLKEENKMPTSTSSFGESNHHTLERHLPTDQESTASDGITCSRSDDKISITETSKNTVTLTEIDDESKVEEVLEKEQIPITEKEESAFSLPVNPELKSFQQKSDRESFELSPISVNENFISASDVSSEISNFDTAKSSPSSFDVCDKQVSDNSDSSNYLPEDGRGKDDTVSYQKTRLDSKDSVDEISYDSVSPPLLKEAIPVEENASESADDFADFQQAKEMYFSPDVRDVEPVDELNRPNSTVNDEVSSDPNADVDEFADFTCAPIEEDFADFASSNVSWSQSEDNVVQLEEPSFEKGDAVQEVHKNKSDLLDSSSKVSDRPQNIITRSIWATFPIIQEEKITSSEEVFPFKNETDYTSMLLRGRSKRLWDRLQDLDTTPAMLFRWASSQCFQNTLHALNIDSHSILRNPSVPIFASSLGLLEPTKGPTQSPKRKTSEQKHILHQESVPPVQFDWNDSGLINPLDTPQVSGLFDLDFFATQDSTTSSDITNSGLEEELLGPSTAHTLKSDNGSPLLKQILSSTKSTILSAAQRQNSRPLDLSDEVIRVLDKLPDLSFMRAKVLMFPIQNLSEY